MDETLDAGLELGEGAEGGELSNTGGHDLADKEAVAELVPRLLAQALQAERDLLLVAVNAEDKHLDLVADLHNVAWVSNGRPGKLCQVDEAVRAANVDKCAKVGHARHPAGSHLTLGELVDQPITVADPALLI